MTTAQQIRHLQRELKKYKDLLIIANRAIKAKSQKIRDLQDYIRNDLIRK
jgi:CO dehydrogenase nickel-insertion accessory protein CooC1